MSNPFWNQVNQRGIPQQYQQEGINPGFISNGGHHAQQGVPYHHHPQPPQGYSQPGLLVPVQHPPYYVQNVHGLGTQQQYQSVIPQFIQNPPNSYAMQNVHPGFNPQHQSNILQYAQMISSQRVAHQEAAELKPTKKHLSLVNPKNKEPVKINEDFVKEIPNMEMREPDRELDKVKKNLKEIVANKLGIDDSLFKKEPISEVGQTKDIQEKNRVVEKFRQGVEKEFKLKEIESTVDEAVQKIRQEGGEGSYVRAIHHLFVSNIYDVMKISSFCSLCLEGLKEKDDKEKEKVNLLGNDEMEKIRLEISNMKVKHPAALSTKSYSKEFLKLLRVLVSRISSESLDQDKPMTSFISNKRIPHPVNTSVFKTNNQRQGSILYQGRFSDKGISSFNNQQKGQIVGRASLDRSQMAPPLSEKLKVEPMKRSATAWKPKREQKLDPEEAKYLMKKLEIRGLLNKVTPSNYEDMKTAFCDFQVHNDAKMLADVIDLIFDKAVEEPRFCPMYADLCKDQVVSERSLSDEKSDLFRKGLIIKCQQNFNVKGFEEKLKELEKQLLSESINEAEKELLEEEIKMVKSKGKRRAKGIITLIAELYRLNMLQDVIINFCIVNLMQLYTQLNEEEYVEFAVHFLETIGPTYDVQRNEVLERQKEYEIRKKKEEQMGALTRSCWRKPKEEEATEKQEELAIEESKEQKKVESVFQHLRSNYRTYSQRTGILIINLLDSRQNKWKQQLEKHGGLKTIEEVRQEAEREQLEKSKIRQEFNQKQKYGTYNGPRLQTRHSLPASYVQRNSGNSGKFHGQQFMNDKLAKAAQNSQNVGSEAPHRDMNLKEAVNSDQQLGPCRRR